MSAASAVRLLLLAAIWGGSFLFMRMAAPVIGPALLIAARVLSAALFLMLVARATRRPTALLKHWQHYLFFGLFGSALPFYLFAQAAQTLPASLLSILNATSPIWAACIGVVWLGNRLSGKAMLGLLLGVAGVALLVGLDASIVVAGYGPVLTVLGAPLCYGIVTNYVKSPLATRLGGPAEAFDNAYGSMWAASLLIVPPALAVMQPVAPGALTGQIVMAVLALGVVCSGVAYLLYFRLIVDIGPVSALTVTFLIPVFGVLFGHAFLGEAVGWNTLIGALIVLWGTALVTDFSPRALFARDEKMKDV